MSKRYRDDDISKYTDITTISKVHDLFVRYNKIHTVTLIMEDLWDSRGVWEWVTTTPGLDIALHGWRHVDYSKMYQEDVFNHIKISLDHWNVNLARLGKAIPLKIMYPPWNASSQCLVDTCAHFGLVVNTDIDTSRVVNIHWWEYIEGRNLNKLEEILKND